MTAYGTVDAAVEAMKRGAYDFVTKPVNIDRLDLLIKRALHGSEVERENVRLREQVDKRYGLDNFVGDSSAMSHVLDTIKQVAPSRATVLISGESGTGKELAAQAIHRLSPRHGAPFVAVHCAALSPQLLESELFGHEKGAFTGAGERRVGRFEQAAGGTLFLDEIGEIDATTQVKILRVLGERVFERVGGNKTIAAEVRLLAATNRDLAKMVAEGKFREDLFFRLNVVQVHLPPLRDRREDIPPLVVHFLRESAKENDKPFREVTSDALKCLTAYDWPGNVRELRAAIEHGVVMAGGPKITLRDLPPGVRAAAAGDAPRAPSRSISTKPSCPSCAAPSPKAKATARWPLKNSASADAPSTGNCASTHSSPPANFMGLEIGLQGLLYAFEQGRAMVWLRRLVVAMIIGLLATMWFAYKFNGFSVPESMDQAQIGRQLATGQGFTTLYARPLALHLMLVRTGTLASPSRKPAKLPSARCSMPSSCGPAASLSPPARTSRWSQPSAPSPRSPSSSSLVRSPSPTCSADGCSTGPWP